VSSPSLLASVQTIGLERAAPAVVAEVAEIDGVLEVRWTD
jgi:hypothetical protein